MENILQGKFLLSGIFTTFTGVSIGKDKFINNGAFPKRVVRHPITYLPFIPGSTLRGAVRRITEKKLYNGEKHEIDQNNYKNCHICQIFGVPFQQNNFLGPVLPGRVIFRDSYLTKESLTNLQKINQKSDITETKVCVNFDRITCQGTSYGIEQIPAGAYFRFAIFFSVYEENDVNFFKELLESLKSLENSSLGSHGSRGLGKICFGKWVLDDSNCIKNELESGVSLKWHSKGYYKGTSQETSLINLTDKIGIQGIIDRFNEITKAIGAVKKK